MQALRYVTRMNAAGKPVLPRLKLQTGTPVEVTLLVPAPEAADLIAASETSLEFWDNPIDDQVWNDA